MKVLNLLRHLFLPHYSNNQKARLIHAEILLLIAALLVGVQIFIGLGTKAKILGYAANISVQEVVGLTNQQRVSKGLSELKFSEVLSEAARQKGLDMLEKNYWAHVGPDGTEPWDFFARVDYEYRYAGENLARDFTNPNSAVEAWMASPSHRDNLLSPRYEEIGVAVVEGDLAGVDTTIIVQLFGTRSQPISVPVAQAEDNQQNGFVPSANAQEVNSLSDAEKMDQQESEKEVKRYGPGSTNLQNTPLESPFDVTRKVALFASAAIILVLVMDIIQVERRGISRVGGRNVAHLAFILTLVIILLITQSGEII